MLSSVKVNNNNNTPNLNWVNKSHQFDLISLNDDSSQEDIIDIDNYMDNFRLKMEKSVEVKCACCENIVRSINEETNQNFSSSQEAVNSILKERQNLISVNISEQKKYQKII